MATSKATAKKRTLAKGAPVEAPIRKAAHKQVAKRARTRRDATRATPKSVPAERPKRQAVKKTTARAKTTRKTSTRIASAKKASSPRGSTGRLAARASALRVALELGPRGKKFAAVAPDWPGLERGGRTPEAATQMLRAYLPRYAAVAKLAKMNAEFSAIATVDEVERYPGTGSTDFWGISFAFSSIDNQEMSIEQLDRDLTLMQACWAFFDEVRGRVSAEMQRGPRGGGRDRDHIVRHTLSVEQDWAKKVGVHTPDGAVVTDAKGLKAYRGEYCTAIRTFHSEGRMARSWPLRFLIRHTAYHTMDHAWEMEDKNLCGRAV